ncbi:MAG TPA: hypothetical protein VFU07_00300 [Candidatus Lumbricidophila sp.]|nr:hypothetical protein [Candidatus Lumbricidophila sp.]
MAYERLDQIIDRVLAVQRPVVLAHLRGIRKHAPHATTEQLVQTLERRYLAAVTAGGTAVGASAVIPGVSTGVALALSGVETAGFLEATALFAQSLAEVHGIPVTDPDRARALVMTMLIGGEGAALVQRFAGQARGGDAQQAYWGEVVTQSLPNALVGPVVRGLGDKFLRWVTARAGASVVGKAMPFGVGAAIGGIGNHVVGRRVVTQARLAFGPPPLVVPIELEPNGAAGPASIEAPHEKPKRKRSPRRAIER